MATNQNQSAPRSRTEGDVHNDLEDVSALVLGDGGELGAELRRTFVAAGATVIAPRNDQPGLGEADDIVFIDTPSLDTVVDRIPEVFGLREAVLVAVEAWDVDEHYVISLAKIRLLVAGGDDCRARGDERPQEFGP